MNSNRDEARKGRIKDAGPQGTQVFSRQEVDALLGDMNEGDSSSKQARITGVSASVSGQSFPMSSTTTVVGRSDRCGIQLEDSSVSSEHARLVNDSDGWRVVNMLSTNGTFVNDNKISSSPLSDGDRVRFGGVEFVFHDPEGGDQSAKASGGWKRVLPWAAIVVGAAAVVAWLLVSN